MNKDIIDIIVVSLWVMSFFVGRLIGKVSR